ncbi:hypothetical protein BYT27DRAFT_6433498 [Phlegmacium glaucopus]|nr:hypothetical protein BYT27DRAFT_6433498 [Phlegmacium glaucopus]
MAERNTLTTNSPQMQNSDIQEMDEDVRQEPGIYYFKNCGTVYVGVTMENCGNNVPQVTYYHPRIISRERGDKILQSQSHATLNDPLTTTDHLPNTSGRTHISFYVNCVVLFAWAALAAVCCLAVSIISLPRLCGIMERDI